MRELLFNGIGSAFNVELGNNSAFYKKKETMILLDCGGTVFPRMVKNGLLTDLKKLNIIISHTHPDHIGSLGDLIFYAYYILKIPVELYFPEEMRMKKILKHLGVTEEMYSLHAGMKGEICDKSIGKITIDFYRVPHVNTMVSYGFVLAGNERIYYSGDSSAFPQEVLEAFLSGKIAQMYQDTCGLDYIGNPHMSFRKLCDTIPFPYRRQVYCMHLDQHITVEEIIEEGFVVAPIYQMK